MIDPKATCLFIPNGLSRFKNDLFERIGRHIQEKGGSVIRLGDVNALAKLPDDITPIVGAMPEIKHLYAEWKIRGRRWIYWDRGYARRVFATWLPRGENGGYYRYHINSFQMREIKSDLSDDRWKQLLPGNKIDPRPIEVKPWSKGGKHIVLAEAPPGYAGLHGVEGWTDKVIARLKKLTDRPIVRRRKDELDRPLSRDLEGAHCLVAHGSIAAVEAVVLGCPVFVDVGSAASLVGLNDISLIESPVYPERQPWLNSLAYSQFNEAELVDGTLWNLLR